MDRGRDRGDRLDVGFVPAEVPGSGGSGAVQTSTLLIEHLSRHHDLTVYVASQHGAEEAALPATDRAEYVVHDELPKLPHPITSKHRGLRRSLDAMDEHDLVHAYSSAFIPVLADLDAPTISTLNSYLPVCPKGDMMYHGERKCGGPWPPKCASCIAATAAKRRQGVESELRATYSALGKIPLVERSRERSDEIDAYHALSPHLRDDYVRLGFPADRISVIPHFYDEAFHRPDRAGGEGADGGPGDGPATLLYVGGLRDYKGVQVLIRGLAVLRERERPVRLRIAGSGPYEDRLRELAAEAGVADGVEWLGYVDNEELPAVYADADAFVYPGLLDEPFGRVLLEALASHTPVVASDVGSTDYIVGEAGVRFETGDAESLADACERLFDDYERYRGAVPDHLTTFAPETVVESFSELYREVAASGSADTDSDRRSPARI